MDEQKAILDLGIALGQNHAFGLIAGKCSAAQAETLRRIREEKQYLKFAPRWDEFCQQFVGMNRSNVDHMIQLLEEFGPNYFAVSQLTRISAEMYREIAPAVKDGTLEFKGEVIELAPENARQVTRAVAELRREAAEKKKASVPATPDRLADLDRRFDALMREVRELSSDRVPDRAGVAEMLAAMMSRLGSVVQQHRF
jgi:hypothetical protein